MGTYTINFNTGQDNRLKAAFGKYLNTQDTDDPRNPVARDATSEEIEDQIYGFLNRVVGDQEVKTAKENAGRGVPGLGLKR